MSRRIVGPFNRVEGDLEVQLDIEQDRVVSARVVSPLYRGFEQMLLGKAPADALVYVPRICGICSVAQSVAAASALAHAQGLAMPENGQLMTNLVLATENMADHLTHFYLFFMPDFARDSYQAQPWFYAAAQRYRAVSGDAAKQVLPARAAFMHLMGILAGKWPHTLSLQPGGSTRAVESNEIFRVSNTLYAFRQFLQTSLFGDSLENILAIRTEQELNQWAEQKPYTSSDLRFFLHLSDSLNLQILGKTELNFISFGAYAQTAGHLFQRGEWNGSRHSLDSATIAEDVSHSWMNQQPVAKHPFQGDTIPNADAADAADAYTWCKAPRLGGRVVEVGALARQVVNGQPLITDLVKHSHGNVRNRVLARLWELAQVVVAMENWAKALKPRQPFCESAALPEEAESAGLIEAARGSLGHWLKIKNGRIANYQIIAPTTWNFSPRDQTGTPGALEQALVNTPVMPGDADSVAVQHVVRSFDPCMVCTVH